MSAMNFAKEARVLVNYIECLNTFNTLHVPKKPVYSHIGGLFTDITLQSGLNYKHIVKPRVIHIINNYPEASTVDGFSKAIETNGLSRIINWKHPIKLQRIIDVIKFSKENNINTCIDMQQFLGFKSNQDDFLKINGFGPKTLDYTLKLLSFDTVAVDRHITSFVQQAGIDLNDYYTVKRVVEYAADIMGISRTSIDFSIWKYMSEGKEKQLKLVFN